jgi:hypothetical protein
LILVLKKNKIIGAKNLKTSRTLRPSKGPNKKKSKLFSKNRKK